MRIYRRGKTYYLDFTYRGERIRKAVDNNKKVAELAAKETEVRIAKEEHLGIFDVKKVTLREFSDDYLKFSKANKTLSSFKRDQLSMKFLIAAFGSKLLSKITPQDIESYKIQRREKVSAASVNRELACLSHMFTIAINWKIVTSNPVKKVKKFKEPPGRLRYLSMEELDRLIDASSDDLKPIIITAFNTGMRKSEILHLKWDNVDLDSRTITVVESKNNEIRVIPINSWLYETLITHPSFRKHKFVFTRKNGERVTCFKTAFDNALSRSGIEDFHFHDLRHTFASHLVMNGENLKTVQQLLGHKDIKMTMRYSHLSKDYVQQAVDSLCRSDKRNGTNMAHGQFSEEAKSSRKAVI